MERLGQLALGGLVGQPLQRRDQESADLGRVLPLDVAIGQAGAVERLALRDVVERLVDASQEAVGVDDAAVVETERVLLAWRDAEAERGAPHAPSGERQAVDPEQPADAEDSADQGRYTGPPHQRPGRVEDVPGERLDVAHHLAPRPRLPLHLAGGLFLFDPDGLSDGDV